MPVLCVCQYPPCRITFSIKSSNAARGEGKFCSRACYQAMRPRRIEQVCIQCGIAFSIRPSALRQGTGEFCSKRCRGDATIAGFAERFWTNIQRCEHDIMCLYCCWSWQKYQSPSGHGRVARAGKNAVASRAAWELWHGRMMPTAFDAAHYCNNPACCNPSHIYQATRQQNVEDAIKAGTFIRGSRAGASKLTEADIPRIFAMRAGGMPVREIAQYFPVQSHAIDNILARRTWRHVIIDQDGLLASLSLQYLELLGLHEHVG